MALVKNTATATKGKTAKAVDAVRLNTANGNLVVRITKSNSARARGISLSKEDAMDLLSTEFRADLENVIKTGKDGEFVKKTEKGFAVKVSSAAVAISLTEEGWNEFFGLESQIMAI
jgi:hypothetical protein